MKQVPSTIAAVCLQHHHETDILGTRMALRITQRTGLVIAIITFMTTMVRTESEIPEDKVIVDVRPVFLRGYDGMLQCRFNGAPLALFWLKGPNLTTATNLVTWYPPPKGVSGSGYVSGKYNLTEDFSLVIHEVQDDDAGRYICRISNFNGFILRNYTEATVKTPPQDPFPTIDQCPTEADGRGTESCILTQETGVDSTELTCRTMGATRGVVSLSWTHRGTTVTLQAPQRSTNPDGVTEDVMVAISAAPSADPYVCVAFLPATTRRQTTMSVTVNAAPIIIVTTSETVMTTNDTAFVPEPSENETIVIIGVLITIIFLVVAVVLIIKFFKERNSRSGYNRAKFPKIKDKGNISYFELETLVEKFNIGSLSLIVAELIEDSEREKEPVCTKANLYTKLCEWKESSSGSAILLYSALEKNDLHDEHNIVEEFLASADDTVSDDDLEHICWHVHSCRQTVQPIVGSLPYSYTNSTKPADNGHISEPSRCNAIRDDLQIMKRWKGMSAATTYGDEDVHCDETVKFQSEKSEEISFKSKHANTMPSNQMIKLCRALEKAAKKNRDNDGQVYHQLSRTFYKIREEYKSELTDEVLKKFALNITERHCQRLGNTLKLSADDIATRNEEDLKMYRTDMMLKAWLLDQKCSNYEIRLRLRHAAEQCNRQDIADNFISKEQSEVMTSTTKLPACLTITNEKQSPGASASGSRDEFGNGASSQSVPHISHGDLKDTQTSVAQPAANIAESEIGFVSVISRDELDRIGRYGGSAVLLALCKKYDVTEVPEQQSPEGKELPFETKIINVLKPKLDSEHEITTDKTEGNTPRKTLRQLLQNKHRRYACLLAKRKPNDIFNVELIDLAFRLIMSDVYPFAKALNISDLVLTPNRGNLGPHNLRQGTVKIMLQVTTDYRPKMVKDIVKTDYRFKTVKALKQAGYSEEARALYFGFEISFGDVVEVENRVDKAQLAKQLGVSDDVQSTGTDNQVKDDTLHQSVLLRWRDTVRSSTFNPRLVLADALFALDDEQLALDIISGVYRKRAIDNPVSERLAATIQEGELVTLSNVLGQKMKKGQTCQDVITAWVAEKKLIKLLAKSPIKLSNELLDAGFYAFAHEIMAGAWKEDKKAGQKEGTETGNVELRQRGTAINKPGEKEGKEEKENMEKAINGDKLVDNTGKEGTRKGNVGETDVEPVAIDNENELTEGIQDANTSEEGASQNSEDKKSSGKEATVTNDVVVEISGEENPSTKEEGAKHEASQNREDTKSSGKEATDTNDVVAEISGEENPSNKGEGAKHEASQNREENKSSGKEATDTNVVAEISGEESPKKEDWVIFSEEDLMQAKSGDGAAESKEDTTENVDTKEQDVMQVKSGDGAAESKENTTENVDTM